jgi:hypothetical protein
MVKLVKQVIMGFLNYHESNWTQLFREAQFAINNSVTVATGFTPHYLAYAFQPSFLFSKTQSLLGDEFKRHLRGGSLPSIMQICECKQMSKDV